MSRRLIAALALASAVVPWSVATSRVANAATSAPAPAATVDAATAQPDAAPSGTPEPTAPQRSKAGPRPTAAHAPSAEPSAASPEPAPSAAASPLEVPATKTPVVRGEQAPGFVYLRDRYRRDDQGAALRTPIAQLARLDYLLGIWSAHIYTLTAAHKPTRDFGHTTYVFAKTMNGRWILGTDAKNTEFLYFTYDPPAHHWVYNDVKGFPSYGLSYATGNARHLKFEAVVESALGDERRLRTSLDSVDAKHFTLLDEELTPDDVWTPVVEFDFTKR